MHKVNDLIKYEDPELLWVCRDSVHGRGLRLHQDTLTNIKTLGLQAFGTPQAALDNFIEQKENQQWIPE